MATHAPTPYETALVPFEALTLSENNPREISETEFKALCRDIQADPAFLAQRPTLVSREGEVLNVYAGHQRARACHELGQPVPVFIEDNVPAEVKERRMIMDNTHRGRWDWEILANEWDGKPVEEWGLNLPGVVVNEQNTTNTFTLPEGDKEPFQQMTFTLADAQAEIIKEAMGVAKAEMGEAGEVENYGNKNGNGNALAWIVTEWFERKQNEAE